VSRVVIFSLTLAVYLALAFGLGGVAAAQVTLTKTAVSGGYTSGTLSYEIDLTNSAGNGTGVVIHDPAPAGTTLLTVQAGSSKLDCTKTPTGFLTSDYPMVSCNVGGELQVSLRNDLNNSASLILTYRAPVVAGDVTNTAHVTCMSTCKGTLSSSATVSVVAPAVTLQKSGPPTAAPGSIVTWNLVVANSGPYSIPNFTVQDPIPNGATFSGVDVGGSTFSAADLATPRTAADGAQVSFSAGKLTIVGPQLAPGATYSVISVRAAVAANVDGAVIRNSALATTPGSANVTSSVTTTVSSAPPPLMIDKRVTPNQARLGDPVTYTVTVTPSTAQPGPITVVDPIDPALKLNAVKLNGQVATCGPAPVPLGNFVVGCGADGHTVTLAVPAGQSLTTRLTLELLATVRPTATAQLQNIATLTDATGATLTAAAPLTVTNASTSGASVTVTAAKLQAEKDDLVPFVVQLGVPLGSSALAAPTLALKLSAGLRLTDVHVTGADGTTRAVKPTTSGALLVVPVGALAAGATASVTVRTRVGGRANVGNKETVTATLESNGQSLASGSGGVRILADGDFDLGTILGEVYRDDNGNGVRDRGEPGLGAALVVMDDGLQSVTDNDGRYHLAAVPPGDRAIKVAEYTLPPGSKLTTDVTRIVPVTAGSLSKIDFGVLVPAPEPPAPRPQLSMVLPELKPGDAGRLGYRLTGVTLPGARIHVGTRAGHVDKLGVWGADVELVHGRNRFAIVTELPDGRVIIGAREVFWVERAEGGSLVIPRDEEARMTLRFPAGALAEPSFLLEGTVTSQLRALTVAGQALAPDSQGHFALKLRVPESGAGIAIDAQFSDGLAVRFEHGLLANGDFVLLVGLAEGKLGYVQKSDAGGKSSGFFAQGRVKLYAKGRILGRWLLEGGIDLDTSQLDSWRDLFRGDPQRMFRNLDPDRFYTVYGDASQSTQAAQSHARLFVRVQIDRSELLFGNLQTGLTGVEMGRYSRSATGGRLEFVRAATEANGPPNTQVILFGAWLQTSRAHDELRGTGGSLYYLSHRNIVEGSEQVRLELRDQVSARPESNVAQHATVDYEVDYLAGRVIMRDPVSSIAPSPTLVRSSNIDGDAAYLVVDYEYLVDGDSDDGTLGARATQRLGPVRLGGTVVNEFRSAGDYTLIGGDVQVDLKKYGTIIGEYAHSYGALTSFSTSSDGGLTYADALGTSQSTNTQRQGNAYKAEADLHFGAVTLRPYFRGIDQGYTDTAHAQESSFMQWGIEAAAKAWGFTLRFHYDERHYQQALVYDAAGNPLTTVMDTHRDLGGEIGRSFGRVDVKLGARNEVEEDPDPARAGHRTTVAARVEVHIVPKLSVYVLGQYAVQKGGGDPTTSLIAQDNSLGAIGATVQLPLQTKGTGEVSYGAQGVGGLVSLRTEVGPGRVLYGTTTLSQDRDDRLSAAVAAGGRERIADAKGNARATLYAEDQFREGPLVGAGGTDGGRSHMQTAGLDIPFGKRFVIGASFERGEVTPSGSPLAPAASVPFAGSLALAVPQPLDRTAGSIYASYGGQTLRAQVKAELRQDSLTQPASLADGTAAKTVSELQWLVQSMITWQATHDLTFRGKLLLSQSTGTSTTLPLARSSEANVGFSWRPSWTDRLVLLGRYSWLDEGLPATQAANGPVDPLTGAALGFRERAHVISLAGEGRVIWKFSIGEKVAAKLREESQGDGLQSGWMVLWINRLTMHVTRTWDALAEYRLLYGPGPALSHGIALEINRIIVGHLRIGVGWNFSSVGDDELTVGRSSEKGFFVRAQGFY
jgi:uncharacterized repeat protein (TIGR01451 family)